MVFVFVFRSPSLSEMPPEVPMGEAENLLKQNLMGGDSEWGIG